jgi:hypothetical protein
LQCRYGDVLIIYIYIYVYKLLCLLQALLRNMLVKPIHVRPGVTAVPECPFFKDDRLLRALHFIETILQRDTAQKHAFVRDLPSFYSQFDKRLLRLRVLPCLMRQWQDEAMRDAVLPLVLIMAQDLPADVFQNQVSVPAFRTSTCCVWVACICIGIQHGSGCLPMSFRGR